MTRGIGLLGLIACTALSPVYAQTNIQINNPISNVTNQSQTLAGSLTNLTGTQGTQALDTLQKVATGQQTLESVTQGQAQNILNNIKVNGIPLGTATQLANSLIKGDIQGEIGKLISGISGLGTPEGLTKLATSGLGGLLSGLTGTPAGQTSAITQALTAIGLTGGAGIQGSIQSAIQAGASGVLADAISKAFPELTKMLGGIPGLTGLLSGLLGGTGGLTLTFGSDDPSAGGAGCPCEEHIQTHHSVIKTHMTNKRKEHEIWMVTEFFTKHVAPALMLMAEQLTVAGMQQVQIIGSFFDAKHQLESQRLLQQMTAQAHKDYQPSEGLCTFGTSVRSLAASERAGELAQMAVAARGMQRQLLNNEGISGATGSARVSDSASRMKTFIEKFCDKTDNNKTLDGLCKDTKSTPEQRNRDIDYTRSVENKLTLDLDFYTSGHDNPSDDEENIFALGANLYGHDPLPYIDANLLGERGKDKMFDSEKLLQDARALASKRSVAQNSFSAITGMKAAGTAEAQPYLYKMVAELGVPEADLEQLLGKNPSYFAQMEILTKKALQNPVFYTELYDKPVNVDRKGAVLQAVGLMQDRDIYKSLIRSEAVLSVLLETMLASEQAQVSADIITLNNKSQGANQSSSGGTP